MVCFHCILHLQFSRTGRIQFFCFILWLGPPAILHFPGLFCSSEWDKVSATPFPLIESSSSYSGAMFAIHSGVNQGWLFDFCWYFLWGDKFFSAGENPLENEGGYPGGSVFE